MVKSEITVCNEGATLELSSNSGGNRSNESSCGGHTQWTVLRRFVDNFMRSFALSLLTVSRTHSQQYVSKPHIAYIDNKHTYMLTEPAAFSRAASQKVEAHTIQDIIEQVRVAAGMGKNILQLQQHARAYADASWQRYDRFLCTADYTSALAIAKRMTIDRCSDECTLAARICQNLLGRQQPTTLTLDAPPLCSSSVIMQWIEQQRQHMVRMSLDGELRTPVLLDLSYCGCNADDRSIVLLDNNSIKVNESGVYLHTDQQAAAQRAGVTVMVSAIRAAASLALPVNLTAVMPLGTPPKSNMLPSSTASALPSSPPVTSDRAETGGILILNLCYKPQSVCDLESFGTHASIALIFNIQFPIWRHYHTSRDMSTGQLAPLWLLQPRSPAATVDDTTTLAVSSSSSSAVTHADCSGANMQDLVNLAVHNVVPHMIWCNRSKRPLRSMVHFFRECSGPNGPACAASSSSQRYARLMMMMMKRVTAHAPADFFFTFGK